MAKVTALKKTAKPEFNPNNNYKWEPDDVFEITGQQLASLYHCLVREVNDSQGASIALKYEAFNTIIDVFKRGVEQGAIVEIDAPIEADQVEELEQNVDKLFGGKKDPASIPHWHPNSLG